VDIFFEDFTLKIRQCLESRKCLELAKEKETIKKKIETFFV